MWPNPQETADLVIFTEDILNGKLHFLCSVRFSFDILQKLSFNFLVCFFCKKNQMRISSMMACFTKIVNGAILEMFFSVLNTFFHAISNII